MEKEQKQNIEYCECGDILATHHTCAACGIKIGSQHIERTPKILKGKTFCSQCYVIRLICDILQNKLGMPPDLVAQKIYIKTDKKS